MHSQAQSSSRTCTYDEVAEANTQTVSAESNRPQENGEAWAEMLARRLLLSNRASSIGRLDTSYIASIYSANYDRAPQVINFDGDEFLQPFAEGPVQKKLSKVEVGAGCAQRSGISDTTCLEPQLSDDRESQTLCGEDPESDVKSLDSSTLLKDSTEPTVSLNVQEPLELHANEGLLAHPFAAQTQARAGQPTYVFTRAASLPRAKYMALFNDSSDSDAVVSKSPPSVGQDCCNLVMRQELQSLPSLTSDIDEVGTESSNIHRQEVDRCTLASVSSLDHRHNPGSQLLRRAASENACRLQMTLSMKYIFNDNSTEIENLQALPNDNTSMSYDSNNCSRTSSLEFSTVASFKDWMPSEDPPLIHPSDCDQACQDLDNFERLHTSLATDFPRTKRVLLKYVQDHGDFHQGS